MPRGCWCLEGWGLTSIAQRREGHLRPSASGGPTGSASAGPSGGRLAPQGCFTPLRQCPVRRCFGHGARRGCREALAGGGGFPHLHQRRIVASWHIVTCHHAARGQPTLRGPGLLGCGPALPLSVVTRARHSQLRRVERDLEEEDPGGGPWSTAASHIAAAAALAWGIYSPAPAASGGGGGGSGGSHRGWWAAGPRRRQES